MRVVVPEGKGDAFAATFLRAFEDIAIVAARGDGPAAEVVDPSLARFAGFFRPPPTPEEGGGGLSAWKEMDAAVRAAYALGARWDLGNVLHMLGPTIREWRLGPVVVRDADLVVIHVEGNGMGEADGVIRQIVEYAGGRVLEDPAPFRRFPWGCLRRLGFGQARKGVLPGTP